MFEQVSLLLVYLVLHLEPAQSSQPNIVIIVADDMGYHDVGFRGSPILTPHLDTLARSGVILENHIVSSICSPSRATLMTGRYPIHTGFWRGNLKPTEEFGLELEETLLPEMLKRKGYATHGVGKWHCGMHTWHHTPVARGFNTFFGLYLGEQGYFSHKKAGVLDFRENYTDDEGNIVDKIKYDLKGQYSTDLFSNRSVEIISNHGSSSINPLFLYLAYTAPHIPIEAPAEYVTQYAPHISEERREYATMISRMDHGVGMIVETLVDQGMMDNTILLFMTDNGAYFKAHGSNYPLRGGKSSFLEGGVKSLSFVYSPLLEKSGYTNSHLHHLTDWYATFNNLAGPDMQPVSKPQLPLDGVNIWPSLSQNISCRDEILYELRDPTKRIDERGFRGLHESKKYPIREHEISFRAENSKYAQDFFVIRWKNWKLMTGTSLEIQGWDAESGMHEDYRGFLCGAQVHCKHALASGTLLFDLGADPREETNVAEHHPDIVDRLLGRKQDFLRGVKTMPYVRNSKEGKVKGVWRPWNEL